MIFGLKKVPFQLKVLLNDDEEAPITMIGQKMLPILEKEDGAFMPESMDIVHYIDQNFGERPIISESKNGKLVDWNDNITAIVYRLAMPRWVKAGLEEFKTQSAVDYFTRKKELFIGSFDEAMLSSEMYINEVNHALISLSNLLASDELAEEKLSETDIDLFPTLRSLSVVKDVVFPAKVKNYMENMSNKTGIELHSDIAI